MTKRKVAKGKSTGKDAAPVATSVHAQQDSITALVPEVKIPKQVQSFWDEATEAQRTQLLSFDIRLLFARAAYVKDQPELMNILKEAYKMLRNDDICKYWRWQPHGMAFDHPADLQRYIEIKVFPASLAPCVKHPRIRAALNNSRSAIPETTKALHQRLREIQQEVAAFRLSQQELCKEKPWTVVKESSVLSLICQRLIDEHEFLHNAFAASIQHWLWELKPPSLRGPEPHADICFEAVTFELIDSIAVGIPESVSKLTEWAEQRLADFVRLTCPQTGIDFRRLEPLGVIDDRHGPRVVVQKQWQDAVQCHHTRCPLPDQIKYAYNQMHWSMREEDIFSAAGTSLPSSGAAQAGSVADSAAVRGTTGSAVLQWIYGGEPKPFDALQLLGTNATTSVADRACSQLVKALQDAALRLKDVDQLEAITQQLKQLREQMDKWSHIRRDPTNCQQQLPSEALLCIVRQEHKVTEARLHLNVMESHHLGKELFKVTQRVIQATAELEHLASVEKAIERDFKAMHSNDEFYNQQHKRWVAEQMASELATKVKAKAKVVDSMKALCKDKEVIDRLTLRNEEENSAINAWLFQMDAFIRALQEVMRGLDTQAATLGPWLGPGMPRQQLNYLSAHFHEVQSCLTALALGLGLKDVWPKLSSSATIKGVHEALPKKHKQTVELLEQGCAVLGPLMAQVLEAACDDPAATLLPHLVFPLIKERLHAHTDPKELAFAKSIVHCFGDSKWDPIFSELTQQYQSQVLTAHVTCDEAIHESSIELQKFEEYSECGGIARSKAIQGWSYSVFVDDVCLKPLSPKGASGDDFHELLEVTKLHSLDPGGACLILLFCLSA